MPPTLRRSQFTPESNSKFDTGKVMKIMENQTEAGAYMFSPPLSTILATRSLHCATSPPYQPNTGPTKYTPAVKLTWLNVFTLVEKIFTFIVVSSYVIYLGATSEDGGFVLYFLLGAPVRRSGPCVVSYPPFTPARKLLFVGICALRPYATGPLKLVILTLL